MGSVWAFVSILLGATLPVYTLYAFRQFVPDGWCTSGVWAMVFALQSVLNARYCCEKRVMPFVNCHIPSFLQPVLLALVFQLFQKDIGVLVSVAVFTVLFSFLRCIGCFYYQSMTVQCEESPVCCLPRKLALG